MMRNDEASCVAVEHVLWAAGQGLLPHEVIRDAGFAWPHLSEPDWHDVVLALTIAHRRLHAPAQILPIRRAA